MAVRNLVLKRLNGFAGVIQGILLATSLVFTRRSDKIHCMEVTVSIYTVCLPPVLNLHAKILNYIPVFPFLQIGIKMI